MTDELDDAADEIEDYDPKKSSKWFGRAVWVGIMVLLVSGSALLYWTGILDLNLTATAEVNIGWILEWIAAAIGFGLVLFLAGTLIMALGGDLIARIIRFVAQAMDAYSMDDEN